MINFIPQGYGALTPGYACADSTLNHRGLQIDDCGGSRASKRPSLMFCQDFSFDTMLFRITSARLQAFRFFCSTKSYCCYLIWKQYKHSKSSVRSREFNKPPSVFLAISLSVEEQCSSHLLYSEVAKARLSVKSSINDFQWAFPLSCFQYFLSYLFSHFLWFHVACSLLRQKYMCFYTYHWWFSNSLSWTESPLSIPFIFKLESIRFQPLGGSLPPLRMHWMPVSRLIFFCHLMFWTSSVVSLKPCRLSRSSSVEIIFLSLWNIFKNFNCFNRLKPILTH